MSCQSCSGCFTGSSCSTPKGTKKDTLNDNLRFQSLLDLAASQNWKLESAKDHDHVIPTVMAELSKNVYSSQTALFQAFDTLSQQDFLSLAACLYQLNLVGVHIAWAFEFCQNDAQLLLTILQNKDKEDDKTKLVDHCNDQAEIHELFGQMSPGSVGRVTLSEV